MAGEVAEHGNEKTRKGWKKSDGRRLIGGGGGWGHQLHKVPGKKRQNTAGASH